jgi:tetratricopeptide (TPR) repeat protein
VSGDLEAKIVAVVGRLETVPTQRVARELERRGSWMVRWSTVSACDVLVVGHGAAGSLDRASLRRIGRQAAILGAEVLAEHQFLRRLGVLRPSEPAIRSFTIDDVAANSGLDLDDVRELVLFDVLEPDAGAFAFGDIVLARHARRLLERGLPLAALVHAATLQRRASRLHSARPEPLTRTLGGWANDAGAFAARPIIDRMAIAGRLRERAEEAERVGNVVLAERLYRESLELDGDDAVTWFCVGSVVQRDQRVADAAALFENALDRDPALADAWYALGCISEEADDVPRALACFERALGVERNHLDAVFRLGLLHLITGDTRRAAPLLERYAAADPRSAWGERAREALRTGSQPS